MGGRVWDPQTEEVGAAMEGMLRLPRIPWQPLLAQAPPAPAIAAHQVRENVKARVIFGYVGCAAVTDAAAAAAVGMFCRCCRYCCR